MGLPKNMVDFLAFEASLIEEHKKMFEEQSLFKEYSSFDFMQPWSRFQVVISPFNVQYFFLTFWFQLFFVNNWILLFSRCVCNVS
jgi:hypothetical protein